MTLRATITLDPPAPEILDDRGSVARSSIASIVSAARR